MTNKIALWSKDEVASVYETGQTVEEFLTQHFGGVEQALARGLKVSLNGVEQFREEMEVKVDKAPMRAMAKAAPKKAKPE